MSVDVSEGTAEQVAELVLATGARDPALALELVSQTSNVIGRLPPDATGPELQAAIERRANLALAAVHGIGPADTVEGMLASQMTALHSLAMVTMQRAAGAEHPEVRDRAVRQATRLTGAFLAAADGLKRWRGGPTVQRVVVERVEVKDGGQAIVGAVAGRHD